MANHLMVDGALKFQDNAKPRRRVRRRTLSRPLFVAYFLRGVRSFA